MAWRKREAKQITCREGTWRPEGFESQPRRAENLVVEMDDFKKWDSR